MSVPPDSTFASSSSCPSSLVRGSVDASGGRRGSALTPSSSSSSSSSPSPSAFRSLSPFASPSSSSSSSPSSSFNCPSAGLLPRAPADGDGLSSGLGATDLTASTKSALADDDESASTRASSSSRTSKSPEASSSASASTSVVEAAERSVGEVLGLERGIERAGSEGERAGRAGAPDSVVVGGGIAKSLLSGSGPTARAAVVL
ncbi:hypothetical protein IWX90DRAFT_445632 [Phyllosticta citrichinensis]|uniref:Uncharacterized protein n=1 Tax=Phyllosticta citrichinensis TaxID=1130410 RepID=A0ABR1XG85_9PEZI